MRTLFAFFYRLLLTCLFIFLSITTSFSQEIFETQIISDDLESANVVAACDWESDEDIDIIAAGVGQPGQLVIYTNNGSGIFTEHVLVSSLNYCYDLKIADINNDGFPDIVYASRQDDEIVWLENNQDYSITSHLINGSMDGACGIDVKDLDGDGDLDVVGTASWGDVIKWFENDGNGNFTTHNTISNHNAVSSVFAVDLDGDGDLDWISGTTFNEAMLCWHENDGNMNFTNHVIVNAFQGGLETVYATDIDEDGDVDIYGSAQYGDQVRWFENDGNQNFTNHLITSCDDPCRMAHGDFDCDGDIDLACAVWVDGDFLWFENDGNETFTEHVITGDADDSFGLCAQDIDWDGDLDILGASRGNNTIYLFENSTNPISLAFFDLISPAHGLNINESTVQLTWESSSHPVPEVSISYEVHWTTGTDFSEYNVLEAGNDTTVLIENLEDDTAYLWRVKATGDDGSWRHSLSSFVFNTYFPEPPGDFFILQPINFDTLTYEEMENVHCSWQAAVDPDPDAMVQYNLYFTAFMPEGNFEHSYCDLFSTSFDIPLLNILSENGFNSWEEYINCNISVIAFSQGDTTDCQADHSIILEPTVSVTENGRTGLDQFTILGTYPNPFNNTLTVKINLPDYSSVNLKLYDNLGRLVLSKSGIECSQGIQSININTRGFSSGNYFLQVSDGHHSIKTNKVIHLK